MKLIEYGNKYARQSTWKDFAMVKFCLCAMGILIGFAVPKKARKPVMFGAIAVFVGTYVPLMLKLLRIVLEKPAVEE